MKATKAEAKTERIEVRVSPKQKRLLEMAIALDRQRSLSEFVTTSAVRAAKKIIRLYAQAEMDELTLKEKLLVAELYLNPVPANEKLKELLELRDRMLEPPSK